MQTENMNTLNTEIRLMKTEQNAQMNNITSLVNDLNTEIGHLKTEQNVQMNNITSLVNELNTEIGHVKTEQRDLKQQVDEQALVLKNITALLLCATDKLSAMASSIFPEDCRQVVHTDSTTSGPTRIFVPQPSPNQPKLLMVYCDQTVSGGGWIVFLRRIDNAENFPNRVWQDCKRGFGDLTGSFWLGLQNLHELTARPATLRVELEDFEGNKRYAEYEQFSISGEENGYKLNISGFSGDAGDSLSYHNGMKFSTVDKDQDTSKSHCSQYYQGAWWYKRCSSFGSQLTGHYHSTGPHNKAWQYLYRHHWKGARYSYKKAEMMLRH